LKDFFVDFASKEILEKTENFRKQHIFLIFDMIKCSSVCKRYKVKYVCRWET